MRPVLLLLLAIGCTDDDEPVPVDTAFVDEPLPADCSEVEGAFVAADLDFEAVDRQAEADLSDARFTIELADDGTFASVLASDGEVFVTEGSWSVVDGELVIDPFLPGIGEPTTLECRLDDGRLSLYGFTTFDFGDGQLVDAQFLGELLQLQ